MPQPTPSSDFYTAKSLYTLAGGAAATWIITNFYSKIFPYEPVPSILIALIIAQTISIVGYVTLSKVKKNASGYFIAVINGFLIASSALGFNTANSSVDETAGDKKTGTQQGSLITFMDKTSWLPPARLVQEVRQKSDSLHVITDTLTKTNLDLTISHKENEILYRTIAPENSVEPVASIRQNPEQKSSPIDSLGYQLVNVKLESRLLEHRSRRNHSDGDKIMFDRNMEEFSVRQQRVESQMRRELSQRINQSRQNQQPQNR